jgi:hypothetical protein
MSSLLDSFVIRKEEHNGLVWIELSHDRLIGPIRRDNERWLLEHLQPFQLQAMQWKKRTDASKVSFLLRGTALDEARRWRDVPGNRIRPIDKEFLDASDRELTSTDRVKMIVYRSWAVVSTCVAIIILVIAIFALQQRSQAITETGAATKAREEADLKSRQAEDASKKALEAKQLAEDSQKLLKESLDNQVALYVKQLDAAAARASSLIEAKNSVEASKAFAGWQQLYSALEPKASLPLWTKELTDKVEKHLAKWDKEPPDKAETHSITLELAQRLGRPLARSLKDSTNDNMRYVLKALRNKYYNDALQTADLLAKSDPKAPTARDAEKHFWRLYYGEMAIVESPVVESAMVDFGEVLKANEQMQLPKLASALRTVCEAEFKEP